MKDCIYMVIDKGKVLYESSYIVHTSLMTWSSLAPNGLTTEPID